MQGPTAPLRHRFGNLWLMDEEEDVNAERTPVATATETAARGDGRNAAETTSQVGTETGSCADAQPRRRGHRSTRFRVACASLSNRHTMGTEQCMSAQALARRLVHC